MQHVPIPFRGAYDAVAPVGFAKPPFPSPGQFPMPGMPQVQPQRQGFASGYGASQVAPPGVISSTAMRGAAGPSGHAPAPVLAPAGLSVAPSGLSPVNSRAVMPGPQSPNGEFFPQLINGTPIPPSPVDILVERFDIEPCSDFSAK